jgi:hypothetical protein
VYYFDYCGGDFCYDGACGRDGTGVGIAYVSDDQCIADRHFDDDGCDL